MLIGVCGVSFLGLVCGFSGVVFCCLAVYLLLIAVCVFSVVVSDFRCYYIIVFLYEFIFDVITLDYMWVVWVLRAVGC